jgi:hypothetical protein
MRLVGWLAGLCFCCAALLVVRDVRAEDKALATVRLTFVPTDRTQIAVWVEKSDGTFMGTFALSYAVATLGIGNRPGALQMNSGFRWPYGRREGVLPVWAHRRAAAPGAKQWRRVIFQQRIEGFASRTREDSSPDEYYCLSFAKDKSSKDALDAVTCASLFNSDKGRFITSTDVKNGYSEPYERSAGDGSMRPLNLISLYPPRRDVLACGGAGSGCNDTDDVNRYKSHALSVMPELDAIAHATPPGEALADWSFDVPRDWPINEDYVLFIEASVEGDYNGSFSNAQFPTPTAPADGWDSYAHDYGYPYRGQPSVVYALPFRLDHTAAVRVSQPAGYGSLGGEDGTLHTMDGSITNDPHAKVGSGADRLRLVDGTRATVRVSQLDPCALDNAPAECGKTCAQQDCGELECDPKTMTCQAYCVITKAPGAVKNLKVSRYPEERRAHMWAVLTFDMPESERKISAFDVQVRPEGGEWEQAFTYDHEQELLPVALDVCADPDEPMVNMCMAAKVGQSMKSVLANLRPDTHYDLRISARDEKCQESGPVSQTEFSTPARKFATVSPCFIASAAYGTPLAAEISVLREVRDRYLAPTAPGRAFIAAYYRVGPVLAEQVRQHAWLRGMTRAILSPLVALAAWWMS